MAELLVRNANDNDIKAIADLEVTCLKAPWPERVIVDELHTNPCAIVLVGEIDGAVVAYLDFMITFDSATISRIAVNPDYRRRGFARILIEKMVEICAKQEEKVEWITLEVRESNEKAIGLYSNTGWEKVTIKKNYYDDGENAIYMVRTL
ncbi:MAG: ribosomal protein S18-alanine N-acetyltransferase [Bacilli bacterium]|nr:ribosomal protein S18-alanine N-acetyltransferase [Bacilli bacterium]